MLATGASSPARNCAPPREPVLADAPRGSPRVHRDGHLVGTPLRVTVRSSNVGSLIWMVMAAAAVVLFAMIIRRLVLRGLHTRSEPM